MSEATAQDFVTVICFDIILCFVCGVMLRVRSRVRRVNLLLNKMPTISEVPLVCVCVCVCMLSLPVSVLEAAAQDFITVVFLVCVCVCVRHARRCVCIRAYKHIRSRERARTHTHAHTRVHISLSHTHSLTHTHIRTVSRPNFHTHTTYSLFLSTTPTQCFRASMGKNTVDAVAAVAQTAKVGCQNFSYILLKNLMCTVECYL